MASYVETNVSGTAVLLEAIARKKHRVRRLVVASSRAVYGEGAYSCPVCGVVAPAFRSRNRLEAAQWDVECPRCLSTVTHMATSEGKPLAPGSVYAITKRDQEELCLCIGAAYGIETLALRYFNVYGAGQPLDNPYTGLIPAFAARVLSGQAAEVYEDGAPLRDFVHIEDVAWANVLALEADGVSGHSLNIGSGAPVSIWEAAESVTHNLDGSLPPLITGRYRLGDVRHCYADISLARETLGYRPSISFDKGIRGMREWLRRHFRGDFSRVAMRKMDELGLAGLGARQ
jgi:dTDP-L-rhamnose 4-epimerase